MTKETLKLALEALEKAADAIDSWGSYASGYFQVKHDLENDISKARNAITAIKEALANDALEKKAENARELGLNYEPEVFSKQNYLNGYCVGQSDLLAEQAKQEPVAWITEWEGQYSSGKILDYIAHTRGEKVEYTPLYTTPPQRTWVGLTLTQVKLLWEGVQEEAIKSGDSVNWIFYTHINEALKEKNA